MRELSLNILDIVENSVKAKASLIIINITAEANILKIEIIDNGCGMDERFLKNVIDPFTTTRTTRNVGMGIPLFKMAAESANGNFNIESEVGKGTKVLATFEIDNIDRAPLGDIVSTIITLLNNKIDYFWCFDINGRKFVFDTREFKREIKDIDFDSADMLFIIKDFLIENIQIVIGGELL